MSVGTYSLAREGDKLLSPHFRVREFACRDGADLVKIDTDLVELLERIRPEIALISVGKHNSYGHPDPGTVERLLAAGAEVYRTDLHGTVTVRRKEA